MFVDWRNKNNSLAPIVYLDFELKPDLVDTAAASQGLNSQEVEFEIRLCY